MQQVGISARGAVAAGALCACTLCAPLRAQPAVPLGAPPVAQAVNLGVNHAIAFADDAVARGQADHWATPQETQALGAGDCEDLAVAKFFALRAAGMPPWRLRLAHARVQIGGAGGPWRPHMVLALLPTDGGDAWILDNLLDDVRPLSQRPDLQVLISFDTEWVWAGLERGVPVRGARRIVPWAALLERLGTPRH